MTNDELEAKLEYYRKEYAGLLEACEADRQARLKLVEECERLKRELNAAVEHHSSYTNAIDKSLNCRRYSGSLLQSHLSSIELLKQQRDQYESELRAAEELNRRWAVDYAAMIDERMERISQLEAERDEARKECERLKDEINHWKVKAECYGEMVHGCHPVFVRLGVLDENNSGVGAIANAAQKLATINDQLKAERDEWKQAANTLASDIKRLSVRAEMPQDAEIKEGRWQSVERELCDLQQRIVKLEQFHEAIVKPGTGFTVVTLPQEIEPLPAVTEVVEPVFKVGDVVVDESASSKPICIVKKIRMSGYLVLDSGDGVEFATHPKLVRYATPAERAAFFAANPKLHPAYKPEHGDMAGWRYLESDELLEEGDNFWNYYENTWSNFMIRVGEPQFNSGHPYRRRVQAEKEVG